MKGPLQKELPLYDAFACNPFAFANILNNGSSRWIYAKTSINQSPNWLAEVKIGGIVGISTPNSICQVGIFFV